ncbi:fanconi anemia group J protein [Tanacetum coccineum]
MDGGDLSLGMRVETGNMMPTLSDTNIMTLKKKRGPVIYYANYKDSRLVIMEDTFTDKSSDWRIPENKLPCAYAVLGSRKRYCTNTDVRGLDNIDEKCKLLIKVSDRKNIRCKEFLNAPMIRAHPSVRKGGCYEVHDIEDLVKVGEMVRGCSYFGAQGMAEVADIVFCPYNYIINPQIRKAMEISVEGNIIILDEAHNIEDIARDAGSIDVGEDVLFQLQTELDDLCQSKRVAEPDQLGIYRPLYEMIELDSTEEKILGKA